MSASARWLLYTVLAGAAYVVIRVYALGPFAATGAILAACLAAPVILSVTRKRR